MNHFLRKILEGYRNWNLFRETFHGSISLTGNHIQDVDFSGCNLNGVDLEDCLIEHCNFKSCDLTSASFKNVKLIDCKFSKPLPDVKYKPRDERDLIIRESLHSAANLTLSNFSNCKIRDCNFRGCLLSQANFSEAKIWNSDFSYSYCFRVNFYDTDIIASNFAFADLSETTFIETKFVSSDLSNARIYGISAWDIDIDDKSIQKNLSLNRTGESEITVDNIEIGQFIYLLLNNKKFREVIDTLTSKLVLILGRFSVERKISLTKIKDKLRELNYVPVLFDFEKPLSRDFIETISGLAHLSRFIIADFSDSKIVLEEVPHIAAIVSVPIKPILIRNEYEPVTIKNLQKYPWFLETFFYKDFNDIIENIQQQIIAPCESKILELKLKK